MERASKLTSVWSAMHSACIEFSSLEALMAYCGFSENFWKMAITTLNPEAIFN